MFTLNSTSPRDIVANIERYLENEPMTKMQPFYRSFKGFIESAGTDKYKVTGVMTKIDGNTIEITELPVRSWTQNFKEGLEEMLVGTEKSPSSIKVFLD